MMEVKKFDYIDNPHEEKIRILDKNLDLQEIYSQCVQELSLQQSKRDQLIAFYLTITGLVSTYLFSADVGFLIRTAIFFGLFIIGCIWSTIAIRYKIYKDIYWMCCKTVSSLFSADREKIDKPYLQHTFYNVIKKCYKSVEKYEGKENGKPKFFKFVVKNLTSAEFLMFLTLALLSAMSGAAFVLSILLYLELGWISYVITAVLSIVFLFLQTVNYNKAAISVYNVVIDQSDKTFNKVFEKAWLLHFFG